MRIPIIAACLLAGLAAAYTITAHASGPVTLPDLPGLGYSLSMQGNAQTGCNNYVVISGNGVTQDTLIGDLPPRCSTAQQEQDRIDALLAAFPPVPPTPTTTAPVTTTIIQTTTVQADPLPAVTITTPAETLPAVTVASPPVEHTVTETVVQTVTETVTEPATPPAATTLDPAWLIALAIRSQALNDTYGLT